ncbi:MAG: AAA family ATPase [Hyphomonadaceae bacterium]
MNVISIRRGSTEELREAAPMMEEDGAQLRRLYGLFLRRWRLIVAVGIAVFAAVMAYTLLSPRIYSATALVMVNPGREQILSQEQMMEDAAPSSAAVDSEIEVLRSEMMSLRLVQSMNLVEDPEWNGALREPGPLQAILAPLRVFSAPVTPGDTTTANVEGSDEELGVARAVRGAVSVRRRGLSYGIEVAMDARSPRRAAELVNRYVELYLETQTEARFDASARANTWLGQRLTELRQEVQAKERAAEQYRVENGLSLAAGGNVANVAPQSAEVQTMLVQARADLAEKEARLRQVQQLLRSGGSADTLANTLTSETIRELRTRESDLTQRVAEYRQRYSAEHPTVLAAETELGNVRQRIDDEIRRITSSLQNEVEVARSRLYSLQGSFGGATGASDENNEAVIHYRELLRDAAAARAVQEDFMTRSHELANQGELPVASSRIVSRATPPGAPSKPNLTSGLLMALLLAGLSGAGIALLLETLDASVSSAEDAERKLGVPAIASVPILRPNDLKGSAPHRRTPEEYLVDKPASAFAEALRVLKTSLTHARVDRRAKVIAITSAVPEEGKTTMSLCLTRISAMSGQRVAVVDCDLRRHSLSSNVARDARVGLLDVLSGDRNWRDAVARDRETSADIIPALATRFTPQDVFDSQAMQRLVEELRNAYDLVILDSAPVLAVAETRTIAAHADLTLVVVRSTKTPAGATRTAIGELQHAGADVAGVAINMIDPRRPGRGTYGDSLYYSYGRSYYHS